MSKFLGISCLVLSMGIANVASADAYKAGEYKNLNAGQKSSIGSMGAVSSVDRVMVTAQALLAEKKMAANQTIKSISAIENDIDNRANMKIELVDANGACSSLLAIVINGYVDAKGNPSKQLNTLVEFIGQPSACE